ncbi:hypothetical protein HY448_02210 [Candidatus Pacearchaeota archaeon]|nr:hypothetical protein [Candidatus Pacearchaeota archaeon]
MKNKKGFLLAEETLKIIIAVISLIFLIYFLTQLYFNTKESKELEFAKESLNHLNESIQAKLNEVEIYNPEGWILVSWPHKTLKGNPGFREEINNDIPNSCSNLGWEKCICICADTTALNLEGSDCDKKGICTQSDFIIDKNEEIRIGPDFLPNWIRPKTDVSRNQITLKDFPVKLIINPEDKKIKKK